jgi:uncharacterized protein with HEPN domain
MLDHAREASVLVQGKAQNSVGVEVGTGLALVRLLEIIGEAASRVPADERSQHPTVPWAAIVGLRNRLIHGYDSIDFDILWQVLTQDLPSLISTLEDIVSDEAQS